MLTSHQALEPTTTPCGYRQRLDGAGLTIYVAAGPGWLSVVYARGGGARPTSYSGILCRRKADALAYASRHDELADELSDAIDVAWPEHFLPSDLWS